MPAQTLIPGYKQVDSFGPDEDYIDEEEQVTYITLDLGVVEPTLLPSSSTYRLIGLDTSTPFLQLSGSIFKGRHDTLLGTELLFTEEKDDTQPNKRSLTHVGSTEQRVRFKEVRLKEKANPAAELPASDAIITVEERLAEISTMYMDPEPGPGRTATQTSSSTQPPEYPEGKEATDPSLRRIKGSRKGKEPAVDVGDREDAMDTT